MSDIVPSGVALDISSLMRSYEDTLSPKQMEALPYLAFGSGMPVVAKTIGVPESSIRDWMRKDHRFRSAVADLSLMVEDWQEQRIRELSILAFKRAEEILGQDINYGDNQGRKEQLSMAKFIIEQQGLKRNRSEISHTLTAEAKMNVDEGSVDLVARRLKQIQDRKNKEDEKNIVDAKFRPLDIDSDFAVHPDATLGRLDYDSETAKFMCHVCASRVHNLAEHAREKHGLGVREYRRSFGLPDDVMFDEPYDDYDEQVEREHRALNG